MSPGTTVYDLGEVSPQARSDAGRAGRAPVVDFPVATQDYSVRLAVARIAAPFFPGAGHLIRGDGLTGTFFLALTGLFAALAWACWDCLTRTVETLRLFGFPREFAIWPLPVLYVLAAATHLWSLSSLESAHREAGEGGRAHPLAAGIASLLLPGWGQMLHGHAGRAMAFFALLWTTGAAWVLASGAATRTLIEAGFFLPEKLRWVTSPALLFTLPAVIVVVAVYDAVASAKRR